MAILSYNLSDTIQNNINSIESLRSKILLSPIKPRTELKARWEANLSKAYWGLTLAENPLTKIQMGKLISKPTTKRLSIPEKEVLCYIDTLKMIREYWTAHESALSTKNILEVYDLSCKEVFGTTASYYKSKSDEVKKILDFIESGKDHPVIKAGLLQIEIIKLSPFENGTGRVARLLSHLMLARFGYDLRGLLVIEDYYRNDLVSLKEATQSAENYKNATKWLEYFTEGIRQGMEKTLKSISGTDINKVNSLWKLNERQKKILDSMENPELKVTNKIVQKQFGISQITASRDLSKMVNLGILLPHGKGRSVFYTK